MSIHSSKKIHRTRIITGKIGIISNLKKKFTHLVTNREKRVLCNNYMDIFLSSDIELGKKCYSRQKEYRK